MQCNIYHAMDADDSIIERDAVTENACSLNADRRVGETLTNGDGTDLH